MRDAEMSDTRSMKSSVPATGTSFMATLLVVVSSACCIGPLAVAFSYVGLSAGTMLALENVLGPYRPYILGATVLVLGAGFYMAYRSRGESCEPGQVCALSGTLKVQRVLLWFAAGFIVVLLYFAYIHPNLDVLFGIY